MFHVKHKLFCATFHVKRGIAAFVLSIVGFHVKHSTKYNIKSQNLQLGVIESNSILRDRLDIDFSVAHCNNN